MEKATTNSNEVRVDVEELSVIVEDVKRIYERLTSGDVERAVETVSYMDQNYEGSATSIIQGDWKELSKKHETLVSYYGALQSYLERAYADAVYAQELQNNLVLKGGE